MCGVVILTGITTVQARWYHITKGKNNNFKAVLILHVSIAIGTVKQVIFAVL